MKDPSVMALKINLDPTDEASVTASIVKFYEKVKKSCKTFCGILSDQRWVKLTAGKKHAPTVYEQSVPQMIDKVSQILVCIFIPQPETEI